LTILSGIAAFQNNSEDQGIITAIQQLLGVVRTNLEDNNSVSLGDPTVVKKEEVK
jgi:hypothetical protein